MPSDERMSIAEAVRQSVRLVEARPIALISIQVCLSWFIDITQALVARLPKGVRGYVDLAIFILHLFTSFLAYVVLSRLVMETLEGEALDWGSAFASSLRLNALKGILSLIWRLVLWFFLALCFGIACKGAAGAIGARTGHFMSQYVGSRISIWSTILALAACITRYAFTTPYIALSRGDILGPVALSVQRTKPMIYRLILLNVGFFIIFLAVGEPFRLLAAHRALGPMENLLWNMLRSGLQSFPITIHIVAFTVIAIQDWKTLNKAAIAGDTVQLPG